MARPLKPEEERADALQQALMGEALVRVGVEKGDLSLVRDGKRHQAEAAARGAKPVPASSNSRPPR